MSINAKTLAFLIGMGLFGAVAWALLSPLLVDRRVDEALPDRLPTAEQISAMDAGQRQAAMLRVMRKMAGEPDRSASEPMPVAGSDRAGGPTLLARGRFRDGDAIHRGTGDALLYRLGDGDALLRLENLEVTNGPDLVVYLATHPDPQNASDVEQGFLSLGDLKGNLGNQNYVVPATADLDRYRSVVIWCELFGVLFSPAALTRP